MGWDTWLLQRKVPMAEKKVYFGTVGPFLYPDTDLIGDTDGDFTGETYEALVTSGQLYVATVPVKDQHVVRLIDLTALYTRGTVVPFLSLGSTVVWNMFPSSSGFLFSDFDAVTQVDLTYYTEARLIVVKKAIAGSAGSQICLRYIGAFSTTASDYLALGTSEIYVAIDTINTVLASAWISITTFAKADVFLAIIGLGGDDSTGPEFGNISAQFR